MATIDVLREICNELGIEYQSYSGRSMQGKNCFAIVCEDAMRVVINIAYEFGARSEDPGVLEYVKTDSMGLDTVVYWPGIKWTEQEPGDDTRDDIV